MGNTASGNSVAGFVISPGVGQVFLSNSAIGNGGPGVVVNFSPDAVTLQYGAFATFSENNFYCNDRNRTAGSLCFNVCQSFDPGPSAHCGVLNLGALAAQTPNIEAPPAPPILLQAGSNFWGSTGGPKSSGPGDAAGGVCDLKAGSTAAKPFATVPFAITSWP